MAKKPTNEEGSSEEVAAITVTAVSHLSENGVHYNPGDTFETTPERAEALGELVKPV